MKSINGLIWDCVDISSDGADDNITGTNPVLINACCCGLGGGCGCSPKLPSI